MWRHRVSSLAISGFLSRYLGFPLSLSRISSLAISGFLSRYLGFPLSLSRVSSLAISDFLSRYLGFPLSLSRVSSLAISGFLSRYLGFPLSLCERSFTICLTPYYAYNRKTNVLSVSLNKTFPSFLLNEVARLVNIRDKWSFNFVIFLLMNTLFSPVVVQFLSEDLALFYHQTLCWIWCI